MQILGHIKAVGVREVAKQFELGDIIEKTELM